MSSHNTAWYPNDTEVDMPHQGPYPFNDFASYQFGTSHNQALRSSDDGSQLSPIDIPGSCTIAQYPVDFFEELQEVEEPSPNTGLKLGYRRASTACKQCRHRKIRCIASASDPRGRCINCVRLKKDCSSYLTSQSSEDGADTKRVARVSPTPDESVKGIDLSDPRFNMLGLSEDPNPPFSHSTMWTPMSGAPIPWTDSFASGSVGSGQARLNVRSQSIPTWDGMNMRQPLDANIEDFGFGLETQPPVGLASQFPVYPPVSGSPNAFSQGDAGFPWDSNIYSQPIRSMRGPHEQTNAANTMNGGEGAGFDVHASLSTNQLFPPTVNFTLQGRSQSLPYTGYTSNGRME